MSLWDDILSGSGLPECNSIAQHICTAISNGVGVIEKRVYGDYKIKYLLDKAPIIKYNAPSKIVMKYNAPNKIGITYMPTEISAIKYIAPSKIKITHQCKP